MTDNTNGYVDPDAWAEINRALAVQEQKQRNIRWTQKDLDETLAHIRQGQKEMLRQVIDPLIERIKKLEAQVVELQAYGVEYRGVTELKTYSQHKRR